MLFRLYSIAAAFSIITTLLHSAAIYYSLNWIFSWFDMITHFFGGAMVAALVYTLLYRRASSGTAITHTLIIVFCVGVAWEIFEYTMGLASPLEAGYALDTALDGVADMLGGFFAVHICERIVRRYTQI